MKHEDAYTMDEINEQIARIESPYIFWTHKEIRTLPKLIDRGETIVALTSGFMNGRTWLAVCTNRRMLFINCNMFIGFAQVQIPLDRIQSIDQEFTLFLGSVSIFDGINVFHLRMIIKPAIMPFVKATQEAMYQFKRPGAATAPTSDIAGQIARLAELKEKGYLTDEEFQTQKKKLLAG